MIHGHIVQDHIHHQNHLQQRTINFNNIDIEISGNFVVKYENGSLCIVDLVMI